MSMGTGDAGFSYGGFRNFDMNMDFAKNIFKDFFGGKY